MAEPILRFGSQGDAVQRLQDALRQAGFNPGPSDGRFGATTYNAVRAFQRAHGLPVDGIVGPQTWNALSAQVTPPDETPVSPGTSPATSGARGISVHTGLNRVDPTHYQGWAGQLHGCENDARNMQQLAQAQGFETNLLPTADATSEAVLNAIRSAADTLEPGDIFLISHSGHGGQVPAADDSEEPDRLDETWVLFDRMLVDNELHDALTQFAAGVRILVIPDSCHSGTSAREAILKQRSYEDLAPPPALAARGDPIGIIRSADLLDLVPLPSRASIASRAVPRSVDSIEGLLPPSGGFLPPWLLDLSQQGFNIGPIVNGLLEGLDRATQIQTRGADSADGEGTLLTKNIPYPIQVATYEANRDLYQDIQRGVATRAAVNATVITLAACAPNQLAMESNGAGLYTTMLLRTWANGSFQGDYSGFHDAIQRQMPPTQTPPYEVFGAANAAFEQQKPFSVAPPQQGV